MWNLYLTFFVLLKCSVIISSERNACEGGWFRLVETLQVCASSDHCASNYNERPRSTELSTKTAYLSTRTSKYNEQDFHISNCTPISIWLLIRHGTRLPSVKRINRFRDMEKFRDEILKNQDKVNVRRLCKPEVDMLKNWKWNATIRDEQANYLTTQGYTELKSIARSYQRLFPHLLDREYNKSHFHFRHTNYERTRSSFSAFADGLFGENAHKEIDAKVLINKPDLLLKAYAHCGAWKKQKRVAQSSESESGKFEKSKAFEKLVADVSSFLGFDEQLSVDRIKDIYDLCRYEEAWNFKNGPHSSVWCTILTPSQLRVLEYRDDLIYYYKSSHGSKLNKNVQCRAVKDLLSRLNTQQKVTVYFAHSATLQLTLTALGALKDDQALTADNYLKMTNRKWKTGRISPFAGNVAAVRYTCPDEEKVKFLLNEKVLNFDWCSNDGACDWTEVKKRFATENCDENYCTTH